METVPTRTVSLCMIVKNEEALLGRLLRHVGPYVDEMIVVDTGSTDATASVAKQCGARVLRSTVDDGFSAARNVGIEVASSDWILWVDADEWPTKRLLVWVRTFLESPLREQYDSVYVSRENRIDGRLLNDGRAYEQHIRLFRDYMRVEGMLHEQVFSKDGKTLSAPETCLLLHHKSGARQTSQDDFYAVFMREHGLEGG